MGLMKRLRLQWCRLTALHWWDYAESMCLRERKGFSGVWIEAEGRRCKICSRHEALLPVTKWWEPCVRAWQETR